jgi:lipopolysaccharide transport system permease protein
VKRRNTPQHVELLLLLVKRELGGKYKSTVLGQLWSLANPIATIVIYSLVFGLIFRVQPPPGDPSGLDNFAIFLVVGLLPWLFFANVLNQAAQSIVANGPLVQKVYFPRALIPVSLSLAALTNWSLEMLVLVVALLIVGSNVLPFLPLVLLAMLVLAVFATGVGMVASIVNVYFRDFSYLLTILLQFGFFLAPILYPITMIASLSDQSGGIFGTNITYLQIYSLNPMVAFTEIFRGLMYDNRIPSWELWLEGSLWAAFAVLAGALLFKRTEKRLAELL